MTTPLSSLNLIGQNQQHSFYNVVALHVRDQSLGSFTVLNNHAPMIWAVTLATVTIKTVVDTHTFLIHEGLIDVYYKKILIISTQVTYAS